MLTIGASIGSDGAPDGCWSHNEAYPNQCLGALSLSPGGYLTMPYADAVAGLEAEDPPKPVWCFYATDDFASAEACQSAAGELYQIFQDEGMMHGMDLVAPEIEPSVLQLMLDFIQLLTVANMRREKRLLLKRADEALARTQLLLRISYEMSFINFTSYEYGSSQLIELGKLLGGWIKHPGNNKD